MKEFLPGMKVIARNDKKLGVGEIYAAINDQNPSYKVLFTNPPIKLLYPHELHRISIPNGTLVKTRYGIGRIIHIEEKEPDKLYRYNIEFFKKKVTKMLKEDAILKIIPGFKPDLLHPEFIAGHLAGYFLNAYNFRYCLPTDPQYQAICHGRIEAFPHQIGVINHVLSTYPSRFLLCDEVGLGKTIEACAILKELFLRNIIHRAIIVVPANLVPQWKFELESKFNLHFKIYDGKCLKELKNDFPELNPWTIHPRIITSLHFARRDENRELLKDVFFDMAIFDEAHHLRRYHSATGSHRRTKNYDLGETMSNNSRLALFLTATPLQLDPFELFSLIELLDPALFPKYSTFLDFKEKISHYNLVLANLNRFGKLNVFERNYMISTIMEILNGDDWDHSKESIQQSLYTRDPKLRKEIIQKIHDRHLLSKI
ncbi:MAG: DEAD/DEAH box helicase [Candidatus Hodarchaeota archaeon]